MIISSNARVRLKDRVNVLICSSQRASRNPKAIEVILDTADGLDWPTLCKCDLSFSAQARCGVWTFLPLKIGRFNMQSTFSDWNRRKGNG